MPIKRKSNGKKYLGWTFSPTKFLPKAKTLKGKIRSAPVISNSEIDFLKFKYPNPENRIPEKVNMAQK